MVLILSMADSVTITYNKTFIVTMDEYDISELARSFLMYKIGKYADTILILYEKPRIQLNRATLRILQEEHSLLTGLQKVVLKLEFSVQSMIKFFLTTNHLQHNYLQTSLALPVVCYGSGMSLNSHYIL